MKQVFLIHAHKDLAQLNGLIARLCDPDFVIYVHLDSKWTVDPGLLHPAAHCILPRVDVRWGGFSQVRAMLGSLRQVIAGERDFDKLVFLSAQDYPVLRNEALKRALAALAGRELIDTVALGPGGWPAAYRYRNFYREGSALPERLACALANRLMRLTGWARRLPVGLVPYGGSAWWTLSRPCLVHLLSQVDQRPDLPRFFSTVLCPDEMFFPDAGDGLALRRTGLAAEFPLCAVARGRGAQSDRAGRGRLRAHSRFRRPLLPQARQRTQRGPARPPGTWRPRRRHGRVGRRRARGRAGPSTGQCSCAAP